MAVDPFPGGLNGQLDVARALERIESLRIQMLAEVNRIDAQHNSQVHAVQLVRESDHASLSELKQTINDKFENVNEFRQALADLGAHMATRRELEATTLSVTVRVDDLARQLGDLRSRIDVGPAELRGLQEGAAQNRGHQEGARLTVGFFFAGLGAFATVLAIIATLITVTSH